MRSRLLPFFAAAALIYVAASPATACEYEKARSARAASASTAKACGAKQAKTTNAVAASKTSCAGHATATATVANASSCEIGKAIQATTVAAHGSCSASKAAMAGAEAGCTYSKNAVAASREDCCAAKAQATVAMADAQSKLDAVVAGSNCSTHRTALKNGAHGDCEACADWAMCEGELSNTQSTTQVVPLKNGVMYVFTASSPKDVRIVQAVLSGRSEHLQALIDAGDKATLCAQCKAFRGAIASGHLTREVVNVEGGSLMIMTSPDKEMVNQLHLLAGIQSPDHIKG